MSDDAKTSGKSGPWDVIMLLARRSPTVVLAAGLVGGSLYLVMLFSERAEESQRKLTENIEKAAEVRLAAATEVQKQLQASNESLLQIAKDVQALVSGQIANMQAMETLRADHAKRVEALQGLEEATRKAKLAELEKQKQTLETRLAEMQAEAQTKYVQRVVATLRARLGRSEYGAMRTARDMLRALGDLQEPDVAELSRVFTADPDRRVRLVALEALAGGAAAGSADAEQRWAEWVWENRDGLTDEERRFVFESNDLTVASFQRRFGLVRRLLEAPTVTPNLKREALDFFRYPPLPKPNETLFAETKDLLLVLRWHRDAILDSSGAAGDVEPLLWSVLNFEPAAYHVWLQALLTKTPAGPMKEQLVRRTETAGPGKVSFLTPAPAALREYWMSPELESRVADFPKFGRLPDYR